MDTLEFQTTKINGKIYLEAQSVIKVLEYIYDTVEKPEIKKKSLEEFKEWIKENETKT